MSKMLFSIHDAGGYTKITGCRIEEDGYPVDPTKFRECTNAQLFYYVKDVLPTKEVKFESNTPNLTQTSLIIENVDQKEMFRMSQVARMRNALSSRIDVFTMFDFFTFNVQATALAASGYFITDDNREEKYLDIVNSGDESLIAALGSYLASYDRLKEFSTLKSQMDQVIEDIKNIEDELEIQTRVTQFIETLG
jgi:hypothetical protein